MGTLKSQIAKISLIYYLIGISACGEPGDGPTEVTSKAQQDTAILKLDNSTGVVKFNNEYVAKIYVHNSGNITAEADKYSVVFEWRCPTDPGFVNYSGPPPIKPIPAGKTVSYDIIIHFTCKPKPIVVPCAIFILSDINLKKVDTLNMKSFNYTLN